MKLCEYILHLRNGDRVRFFEKDDNPNAGRECTIIRVGYFSSGLKVCSACLTQE
jgi:hypothetical protein